VGFLPSIAIDASADRAAVGQQILVPITPASAAYSVTPGVTAPNTGDQIIGNTPITITASQAVAFRWNGEEQKGINSGPGYAGIKNDQMTQAIRTLTNGIELLVGQTAFQGASRAYGTAGTTPFGSDLSATANIRKILSDNGAPLSDIHLTMNTTAGAKMRTLTQLTKANEAADNSLLRQGVLLDVHGFEIRESAQINSTTKGTGTGYVTNGSVAAGATSIPLITGSGTAVAGDCVTFAGDPNIYVVAAGIAAPGTLVINKPGLQTTLAPSTAMTIGNNYAPNLGYHRNAIVAVCRAPALPVEGDMAEDRTTIIDPRSGLAFDVALYKQYRQVLYEISISYGTAVIKSEHIATLLG
jgi:hypothetical protein